MYSKPDSHFTDIRNRNIMDTVHRQLEALCLEIERQLKAKLHLQIGSLVRQYLPQTWVFETELGACSIFIDTEGNARVWHDADDSRDVTLIWRYEALSKVLSSDSKPSVGPNDYPTVLVQTEKGRAAFNFLKKEFGL